MGYALRYREVTNDATNAAVTAWSAETSWTTNPYYLTGLSNGKKYEVQVRYDVSSVWSASAYITPLAPAETSATVDNGTVLESVRITRIAGNSTTYYGYIYRYANRVDVVFDNNSWDLVSYTYTIPGQSTKTGSVSNTKSVTSVTIYIPRSVAITITADPNGVNNASTYSLGAI